MTTKLPESKIPDINSIPGNSMLLDISDVATTLKCSHPTIARMVKERRIPKPLKIGAMVRWRRSDIEEWVAQGCPKYESG